MKRYLVASILIVAVILSASLAGGKASAADLAAIAARSAATTAQAEKETPPPQGVSPATKDIPMPRFATCCCGGPCCMGCGHGKPKNMMDRPMLGPGKHGPGGMHGPREGMMRCDPSRGMMKCRPMGRHHWKGRGMAHKGGIMGLVRHAEELGLSDKQVEKLKGIADNSQIRMIDLRAELAKERIALRNEIESGKDDIRAIRRHLDQVAKLQTDMKETRIQAMIEAKNVLTDEQKKLLKEKLPRLERILD